MKKNKLFKITALILCGLICVTMFSGCGKKEETKKEENVAVADPNITISTETDKKEEEKVERKVKEKSYYLGLNNTEYGDVIFNYTGTFAIDGQVYTANCTYRQLAEKYNGLEANANKPIDPQGIVEANWRTRPEGMSVLFKNSSNVAVATSSTKISNFQAEILPDTHIYDIIGQQPKKIDKSISFIDSVIDLFGKPASVTSSGENSVMLRYSYVKYDVSIDFDLSTQTGYIEIAYN